MIRHDFRKRVYGSLSEFFVKDIQNYVKNRETWFELRRSTITEQIVKHKEYLITVPSQNKDDIRKRTNSLETEKDINIFPEIKGTILK